MGRLLCKLGVHVWFYQNEVVYHPNGEWIALCAVPATRRCTMCDKHQFRDEHCLGLNPPTYVYSWDTYKPTYRHTSSGWVEMWNGRVVCKLNTTKRNGVQNGTQGH